MRNQTLAARETTDVLLISFTERLAPLAQDAELTETLGYALRIAGAKLLELDTRELGVMTAATEELGAGAVLYDSVPGGAGHVRELFARSGEWLEEALSVLFVNQPHHERCETACLDCLLTFDAQEAMNRGLLQRRKAYEKLQRLLDGQFIAPAIALTEDSLISVTTEDTAAQQSAKEARLAKARSKLRTPNTSGSN